MDCVSQLHTANYCVETTPQCNNCFDPGHFLANFPLQAENYFRAALAYKHPEDPEFCDEANYQVCRKFYLEDLGMNSASCCCLPETKAYVKCMFPEWSEKYLTGNQCEYNACAKHGISHEGHKAGRIVTGVAMGIAITMFVFYLNMSARTKKPSETAKTNLSKAPKAPKATVWKSQVVALRTRLAQILSGWRPGTKSTTETVSDAAAAPLPAPVPAPVADPQLAEDEELEKETKNKIPLIV